MAQGVARGPHVARHRAGRHAPFQGALGRARRDPQAPRRPRPALRAGPARRRYQRQDRPTNIAGAAQIAAMISFETQPDRYNHWKLSFDGPVATLTLDVAEDKGLVPGYKLKLNSYDLGVDIELHDALN